MWFSQKKHNNNVTTLICLAISVRAKVLRDPLVQYYRGLNWHMSMWIDMACCFGKGRGSTETLSKLFANHNALGQLTNHNTFRFSEGGPSSNPELIEPFVPGWGERYCNNENYVKNNAIFEPPSMRACSITPPKQNQNFVKEHNRTPLKQNIYKNVKVFTVTFDITDCKLLSDSVIHYVYNSQFWPI